MAAFVVLAVGVYAALLYAAALAPADERPLAQALARLATLLPAYLHELAHAGVSILCTGRGRIRLYSVRQVNKAQRGGGQVALGTSDIWYRGRWTNALISAAPALLLWPAAAWLAWLGSGYVEAAGVGMLAYAGRLSDSDVEHLRASGRA